MIGPSDAFSDRRFCITSTSGNAISGDTISARKNQPRPSRPRAFAATPTTMVNANQKISIPAPANGTPSDCSATLMREQPTKRLFGPPDRLVFGQAAGEGLQETPA